MTTYYRPFKRLAINRHALNTTQASYASPPIAAAFLSAPISAVLFGTRWRAGCGNPFLLFLWSPHINKARVFVPLADKIPDFRAKCVHYTSRSTSP